MPAAVIVDAVRTAGGKRNGRLSGWHPADLAAEVLTALVQHNDLDPALVDDLGGDPNHTYTGTYQWDGGHVYASVRVIPYAGVPTPNPHEQPFTLFLRGSVTGDTATVAGHPDDRNDVQIAVELHRAT